MKRTLRMVCIVPVLTPACVPNAAAAGNAESVDRKERKVYYHKNISYSCGVSVGSGMPSPVPQNPARMDAFR